MKSHQKTIILITVILLGLISVMFLNVQKEKEISESSDENPIEKFQLMEVKTGPDIESPMLFGIINNTEEVVVQMNVEGRIDHDNRSLTPGTAFKKNEILIKVNRLEALYELLIARLNYKYLVQQSLTKIGEQIPQELAKWKAFEHKIDRTLPLPELPKVKLVEEENLLHKLNIYTQYYSTKKLEQKAEGYLYAAPFDGFILESSIGPGAMVKKNESLLTLAKHNSQQVTAHIPIDFVNVLEKSQEIYFVGPNKDTIGTGKFKGTGTKISDSASIETHFTFTGKKSVFTNSTVQIVYSKQKSKHYPSLPKTAIKNNSVYIFAENKLLETPVKIISTKADSVLVDGLPNHCFVIKNTEGVKF